MGASDMLFPRPNSQYQADQNKRVQIIVR